MLGVVLPKTDVKRVKKKPMSLEEYKARQGNVSIETPTNELEELMLGGKLARGRHPVLRRTAGNFSIERTPPQQEVVEEELRTDRRDCGAHHGRRLCEPPGDERQDL